MTKDKFYDQKPLLTDKFINDDVEIRIINIATSLNAKNGTIWIRSNKNDIIVPIVNDIFIKNKIFKSFTILDSKTKPNSSEEYEYTNDYKYLYFFNKDYMYSKNKRLITIVVSSEFRIHGHGEMYMGILHALSLGFLPIYSPYEKNFSLIVGNQNTAFAETNNEAAVVAWLPFIFRSDSVFGNKSATYFRYYENSILQLFKAQ